MVKMYNRYFLAFAVESKPLDQKEIV